MTGIFLLLELSEAASKLFFPAQKCAGIFYAAVAQSRERWRDQTDGGPHPPGCSNFFVREVVDTLNDRQKRFCDEYLVDSDATKAALRAGYSPKTARNACKYFKDGVPVAMTYTLGKSVPADAKFTDTNTWRGIQDNLTSTATDQSLSANQGKVLKGLVDGKAASSHTHDDRYYTESEMNTKLNGKANSSHTHNYAGSGSAGGTANSVNGLTFAAQTTDPGAGSALTTNKVLIVYV